MELHGQLVEISIELIVEFSMGFSAASPCKMIVC